MPDTITRITRRRLDIQGFERVEDALLAPVAPWLRMAFGLCALMAALGTALASPLILLLLMPIASIAAVSPVHPFDLLYNHGIRFLTGTGPLPRRGSPSRFACGLGAFGLCQPLMHFTGLPTLILPLGVAVEWVALRVTGTNGHLVFTVSHVRTVFDSLPARKYKRPSDARSELNNRPPFARET